MKKYQVLVARRYLRSRAVNLLAMLAVMLGVMALILVSSVMSGFAHDMQERIRGIMSHVVVESQQLVAGISDYDRIVRRIEKVPEVKNCSPLVECPLVMMWVGERMREAALRGVDIERELATTELGAYVRRVWDEGEPERSAEKALLTGQPPPPPLKGADYAKAVVACGLGKKSPDFNDDDGRPPKHPGMLVGIEMAALFGDVHRDHRFSGLHRSDAASLTAPTTILTAQTQPFTVVGAFRSGHYEYDSHLVYVPLEAAQELVGLRDRVTSISVRLHSIDRADAAKAAIERAVRNPTPLLDAADAPDPKRVEAHAATVSAWKENEETWLRIVPRASGAARSRAEVLIKELGPVIDRAERPTTLVFDVRWPPTPPGTPPPSFEVILVDSAGRRFSTNPGPRKWYTHLGGGAGRAPVAHALANFVSEDGLDLLDPNSIAQAALTVYDGTLEFGNLRFEDDRGLVVSTWRDKRRNLLRAVEVERIIQVIIMSLMVVIAGFGILAILWLMVKEKTRDIGILMSLGATHGGIVRIFLINGLMIGLLGAALGFAAGWVVSLKLNVIEDALYHWFGWRAFPPDIYYLDKLPHQENPAQFAVFALAAAAVSLAAALWPAIKAARLNPVEALRYE